MKLIKKLDISRRVLQAILLGRRVPLIVGWNITYRCNLRCKYCSAWQREDEELGTGEIIELIDDLAVAGTKYIFFSGGEPLIREDLGEIIDHCRSRDITVGINSNGVLVAKRIEVIKDICEIQFSLDGPAEVHDRIRGPGVFDSVLKAISLCQSADIIVKLSTVISKVSINHLPFVLDLVQKYDVGVYFQPSCEALSGDCNDSEPFRPNEDEYHKAIDYLYREKKRGHRGISNSFAGLRHLRNWPQAKRLYCLSSKIFMNMEPNGDMFICDMFPNYQEYTVSAEPDVCAAFKNMSLPHSCPECWSGSMVEFNLLGSLKPGVLLDVWKRFNR